MRIMLMCEGDAENVAGSFSGISKNIVDNLRLAGDEVSCFNCDLGGWRRYVGALRTFERDRNRWTSQYHYGPVGFSMRTSLARKHYANRGMQPDLVLQFGATFNCPARGKLPYFLYCDSNIRVSQRGAHTGFSTASPLTSAEVDRIAERERRVYEGATAIFTLSEYLRQSFIDDFGMAPDKVRAVGAGPNLDVTQLPGREPAADPTILFVGAGWERKGGDLLLEAFRRVRQQIPNVRLVLIGPARVDTDIPGVESLGFLNKNVPEDLAALRRAYATATVFCLPTRFEPFGIVYLEAMFNRLPCIGPDAWAVPEMVINGRTGFTHRPEDVDDLTSALLRVLQNPDEAKRLGEQGREFAEKKFTWQNVANIMREEFAKGVKQPALAAGKR